jgi:hypothetical protein
VETPLDSNLALRAEMFGFSNDPLDFHWTLGQDILIPKQDDPGLMYFAVKTNQPINQRIDLSIDNLNKNFQSATASLFLTANTKLPSF